MTKGSQEKVVSVEIPGIEGVDMTRTDADSDLCAQCKSLPKLLEGLHYKFPDATELHGRCEPREYLTSASVTVTVVHGGEGGNQPVGPHELFCWVAHSGSKGTGH